MVKPCENEECGKPFIAKRRDTRFCSASCRARAHPLKSRREDLLARNSAAAGVEVRTTPATARQERRVRGLEATIEAARVEAVRGLGEVAAELRIGRDQAADAVAELVAQARRARAAATEGRRRDERLREVEAQLLRVTTLFGGAGAEAGGGGAGCR